MRILKVLGLGTLFSVTAFAALLVVPFLLGTGIEIEMNGSHATGLSAVVVGIVFNPISWGVIVLSFAGAYWMVRVRHDRVRQAS